MTISATVLTKNSEESLASCLQSLERFSEVIVLDTGSVDLTLDIARTFPNVTVYTAHFEGFGALHNRAAAQAQGEWILSLDSDEVLSERLVNEIFSLTLSDRRTVYSFPFYNYFNGKRIRGCGWHPDYHTRLYNKTETKFSDDLVHEKILKDGLKEVLLHHPVKHYSYRSISDFLRKMQHYSSLYAQQNKHKKGSSLRKALVKSLFAFFKSYFLKRGYLDGREGFIISAYNGHTAFYKYLKLEEMNRSDAMHVPPLNRRR